MAGNFKVTVDGATKTVAEFELRAEEAPARIRRLLRELGMFVEYTARDYAPHRTANLAKNIKFEGVHDEGPHRYVAVIGVQKTAPYAKYVEEGTGLYHPLSPHYIFPRNGNFMVWTEKGAFATPYKGTHVHHIKLATKGQFLIFARRTKGQKGQHYMQRALETMEATYLPERLKHLSDEL